MVWGLSVEIFQCYSGFGSILWKHEMGSRLVDRLKLLSCSVRVMLAWDEQSNVVISYFLLRGTIQLPRVPASLLYSDVRCIQFACSGQSTTLVTNKRRLKLGHCNHKLTAKAINISPLQIIWAAGNNYYFTVPVLVFHSIGRHSVPCSLQQRATSYTYKNHLKHWC